MKKIWQKGWGALFVIILLFAVWEISVRIFHVPSWLLPSPSQIVKEMVDGYHVYAEHLLPTLSLALTGLMVGCLIGIIIGIGLHIVPFLRQAFYPLLIISQNIPVIVLAPLLVIWFGFGMLPKMIVITLVCFFPITVSLLDGFQHTNRELWNYMKMAGATRKQLFWKLEWPQALPALFSGLKISATYSVMGAVISEWLGAEKGIGVYMTLASSSFRTDRVFVAIFFVVTYSLLLFVFIKFLEKLVIKWDPEKVDQMSELVVDHIYKSFDNDPVLRDISFFAHEGEFISILGPSGSGKSTLFKVIGGITRQDAGEIYINGERITGKCGYISYMPQSAALMPWRTVLDNVMLGQEIAGRRDPAKAMEMLERAGLKGYEKRLPHQLSGGMKQRVSFIRSLLSPQTLICLDEPFSALDEFTRFDMQKWLLSIWQEYSKTILFVTHNIEEALFLSDRLIILSAKPAQIKKVWQIPFERPRAEQLLYTNEFLQWKKMIYEEIKQG